MQTTELDPQNISAVLDAIPGNTPFVMLNLVRYRKQADYGNQMDREPLSGREVYLQRYRAAFGVIAARSEDTKNIRPIFLGSVQGALVGPADEPWDDVVLVEYPNTAAFRSVVESPEYLRDAAPHRKAALENWRLIAMLQQPLG